MTTCPLCGGIAGNSLLTDDPTVEQVFTEGFVLGFLVERIARMNATGVSQLICVEHVRIIRDLLNKVPDTIIAPQYRHILHMGLVSVK
jgi:hypothetical protein